MRQLLGKIAVFGVLAIFIASIFAPRFGIRPNDIVGTILLISILSAWITGYRMRRRIRRALGRKASETDMASIRTWMQVDETEERSGEKQTVQPQMPVVDVRKSMIASSEITEFRPAESSLLSHPYPARGSYVVPTSFGAGKTGYVLLVLFPVIGIWLTQPAHLTVPLWLRWVLAAYVVAAIFVMIFLRRLKLEIRSDGISYESMFSRNEFIQFSEISSVVLLTDPHSRLNLWPTSTFRDFVITPRAETGKSILRIPLLLFPIAAREALIPLLKPEEIDVGS